MPLNSSNGLVLPLEKIVRRVTIIESSRLSARLGGNVILATETFQHTGSFKFRAAYNVASKVSQSLLITASSGNFGQALAYASSILKKSCIIVMPTTSASVKVHAVREFGGLVEFVDVQVQSRADRVNELAREHPSAYVASSYDDPLVIEGNSGLGREIAALKQPLEMVIAPVGGGGLLSGIIMGMKQSKNIQILGAEPLLANDAARSLKEGKIVRNPTEPRTIADGARVLNLGIHNWEIIRKSKATIVEVSEEHITNAVRLLFELANLKVEPTGALSIGAVMARSDLFRGRTVCCVVSGGNVDPALYSKIIEHQM